MSEYSNYIFVYGTQLDKVNEYAFYLNNNCAFFSEGYLRGILYDIGTYPGAVSDTKSEYFVKGRILRMDDPSAVLKKLDEYEGVGAGHRYPNEYERKVVEILAADRMINCWAYLYNLPVDELKVIASGDYLNQ